MRALPTFKLCGKMWYLWPIGRHAAQTFPHDALLSCSWLACGKLSSTARLSVVHVASSCPAWWLVPGMLAHVMAGAYPMLMLALAFNVTSCAGLPFYPGHVWLLPSQIAIACNLGADD